VTLCNARSTLHYVCADGTLRIERTEPATTQAKHDQYELWYARVNSDCDYSRAETKCGDKCRSVMQEIAAIAGSNTAQQRKKLFVVLYDIQRHWRNAGSSHSSKTSATRDYAHMPRMPRELLPRLGRSNIVTPDVWPYLSQSTLDDVKVMRHIRGKASTQKYQAKWQVLRQRLQLYAAIGAGTVAEAIVANDCWWSGQVAHEKASGGHSLAMSVETAKRSSNVVVHALSLVHHFRCVLRSGYN
jgi:hypothetical protein